MDDNKVAAAILVQIVFGSNPRLQTLLEEQTLNNPADKSQQATAEFLKPWYEAMLKMVTHSDHQRI